MSEETIFIFLLVCIIFLITDISQLKEEVSRIDKKLNKLIEHLEIEVNENIDDEYAFSATYEEEIKKPLEELICRFNNGYIEPSEANFVLGAFNNENKIIGVVGLSRGRRINGIRNLCYRKKCDKIRW